jgi:hypothetical protein
LGIDAASVRLHKATNAVDLPFRLSRICAPLRIEVWIDEKHTRNLIIRCTYAHHLSDYGEDIGRTVRAKPPGRRHQRTRKCSHHRPITAYDLLWVVQRRINYRVTEGPTSIARNIA